MQVAIMTRQHAERVSDISRK